MFNILSLKTSKVEEKMDGISFFFVPGRLQNQKLRQLFSQHVKIVVPKRGIRRGENVLFIEKVFYYSNDIKVNTLNRNALGASFELYSIFLRHLEHINKLSDLLKWAFF